MKDNGENSTLRYLEASRVHSPAGELDEVEIRGADDKKIGSLDGILVDPIERRLRFFVVKTAGWLRKRRYLLPSEWPAQVDSSCKSLRVHVDRRVLADCEEFFRASVPEFSDDDLMAALFGRTA